MTAFPTLINLSFKCTTKVLNEFFFYQVYDDGNIAIVMVALKNSFK